MLVAFDLDDTLCYNEYLYNDIEEAVRYLVGPDAEKAFLEHINNLKLYGFGIKSFTISLLKSLNIDKDYLIYRMEEVLSHATLPIPGAIETLRSFPGSIIITKGCIREQMHKVRQLGIEDVPVFVVEDKTPWDYLDVCRKNRIKPEQLIMVGNSIKSDVNPVKKIGGTTVHIPANTTWSYEMEEGTPDFQIYDIRDLKSVLKAL